MTKMNNRLRQRGYVDQRKPKRVKTENEKEKRESENRRVASQLEWRAT